MTRPTPLNEEIKLDPNRFIVSKTDEKGIITYANDYFIQVVGYTKKELLGQPHNIIRHPDMPKIAFKLMWDQINQGKNFKAVVKNLAKSGKFYWVMTDFEPRYDPISKKIISHTAYRKAAPRKAIEIMEPIYKQLCEIEKQGGMDASYHFLVQFLKDHDTTYEDFIDEITSSPSFFKKILMAFKNFGKN